MSRDPNQDGDENELPNEPEPSTSRAKPSDPDATMREVESTYAVPNSKSKPSDNRFREESGAEKTLDGSNACGTSAEAKRPDTQGSAINPSNSNRADKTVSEMTVIDQTVVESNKKTISSHGKTSSNQESSTPCSKQNIAVDQTTANLQTVGEREDASVLTPAAEIESKPTSDQTVDTTLPETDSSPDDLSFLTEMSMASDEEPLSDPKVEPNDLSHLTEMTFAAGATRENLTTPDDKSRPSEIGATEKTANLPGPSIDSVNKTAKETRTARFNDATYGALPNVEVSDDDELRIHPTDKGPELPTHIGRYEIKRLLGEGTFGKVYEARDPQLDRIVAVKVAKAISGRTQIRRFLREARAAARLRHPNIIPVYEYGQVEGENIIVYEFVAGETLKAYIKRKQIPPLDETVRIIREIADGLHYAHEQGIIHRDMKPENILVDPNGRPHIADFGCARSIDDKTNLTVDGSILGTPMYMSPEQAGGKANVADGRTDIWSLGVMLYEMVSGLRPFQGQLSELLFAICNKDAASIRKLKPDTPPDLDIICTKCLTRELDDRLPTAGLLSDELGRFQRGEPIESRKISTLKRTWMWAKRNQAIAGLMATVAMTLLIGSLVSSSFAVKAYRAQKNRAFAQMDALTTAESSALGGIFSELRPYKNSILPMLKERLSSNTDGNDRAANHRLKMAIIELEEDQSTRGQLAESMVEDLLDSDAGDFFVCRSCLNFHKDELSSSLWDATSDLSKNSNSGKRFRAAAALALYDPDSPNWKKIAPDVASHLASINEIEMVEWLRNVTPVREKLKPTLVKAFLSRDAQSDTMPKRAAAVLSRLFADNVSFLVDLVPDATPQQISYLSGALGINRSVAVDQLNAKLKSLPPHSDSETPLAIKKSNLATVLIQLGEDSSWLEFAGGHDMSVASELTERLAPALTPYQRLEVQIRNWKQIDPNVLAGMLLSLGQYEPFQILDDQKKGLREVLSTVFVEHPNSRVHSSARWLMNEWGFEDNVLAMEADLRSADPAPNLNWHVDLAGNTFALFDPVDSTDIGMSDSAREYWSVESRVARTGFDANEVLYEHFHQKQIPWRFGICIHEVSVGQFIQFQESVLSNYDQRIEKLSVQISDLNKTVLQNDDDAIKANQNVNAGTELTDEEQDKLRTLTKLKKRLETRKKSQLRELKRLAKLDKQTPASEIDFYAALGFCRWTSEELDTECGLPSVEKLQDIYESQTDFSISQEHLAMKGYRLPTSAEWEHACRGFTDTLFPFGQTPSVATEYGWFIANSENQLQKIGQLKPGNSGLFDINGNVSEWCLDWYDKDLPKTPSGERPDVYVDFDPLNQTTRSNHREHRGGSFDSEIFEIRSSRRFSFQQTMGKSELGFRLARTYAMPQSSKLTE